ncbi:MAG: hypothetical protein ABFD92_13675 [Planctomycetaceae bacterium]|nr:hypothetical protein [Planctomycetaceae bacterium]
MRIAVSARVGAAVLIGAFAGGCHGPAARPLQSQQEQGQQERVLALLRAYEAAQERTAKVTLKSGVLSGHYVLTVRRRAQASAASAPAASAPAPWVGHSLDLAAGGLVSTLLGQVVGYAAAGMSPLAVLDDASIRVTGTAVVDGRACILIEGAPSGRSAPLGDVGEVIADRGELTLGHSPDEDAFKFPDGQRPAAPPAQAQVEHPQRPRETWRFAVDAADGFVRRFEVVDAEGKSEFLGSYAKLGEAPAAPASQPRK